MLVFSYENGSESDHEGANARRLLALWKQYHFRQGNLEIRKELSNVDLILGLQVQVFTWNQKDMWYRG